MTGLEKNYMNTVLHHIYIKIILRQFFPATEERLNWSYSPQYFCVSPCEIQPDVSPLQNLQDQSRWHLDKAQGSRDYSLTQIGLEMFLPL